MSRYKAPGGSTYWKLLEHIAASLLLVLVLYMLTRACISLYYTAVEQRRDYNEKVTQTVEQLADVLDD